MSIKVHIDSLSNEQRKRILSELEFENASKRNTNRINPWIEAYHIDEITSEIYLPYAYAFSMGFANTDIYTTIPFTFTGCLRDYQQEIEKETIDELEKKNTIILSLHTGWGKSLYSIYIAIQKGYKIMIILNRLLLINQWQTLIQSVCPGSKCQFIKPKMKMDTTCSFYIINAQNIPKMGKGYFSDIGTLIVDECHLICAQTLYKALFCITPKYVIGLSATPYRPDGLNKLLDLYFGSFKIIRNLYRKHTVYTIRTDIVIEYSVQWDGTMDWNSVLTNQGKNERRNRLIVDLVVKFSTRFFLILVKRVEQGMILVHMLQEAKENVTHLLENKDFDRNARIVIGTAQKCGVGFDHPKLDTLLIASDMEEYYIQSLGRVFRTPESTPIVFDIVDKLSTLERHYKSRRKVYLESGGTIREISEKGLLFLKP